MSLPFAEPKELIPNFPAYLFKPGCLLGCYTMKSVRQPTDGGGGNDDDYDGLPDDGDSKSLWNVFKYLPDYTVLWQR